MYPGVKSYFIYHVNLMCVLGRVNITYYTTKTISVKPKLKNEISNI